MTISQQSKKLHIGKRLETVAEIAAVRLSCENPNCALSAIDVGCDHAKLPIYLVSRKGFSRVTATDINEGPVSSARKNVLSAGEGVSERIDVIKTDGLSGLENVPCNRIIIAGMGGELIKSILCRADFVRAEKEKIGFVLQPQSKEHILREYLFENGYRITDERRVQDGGKLYCIISAVFDGVTRKASLLELYFGKKGLCECDKNFVLAFNKKYSVLSRNIAKRKQKKNDSEKELYDIESELFALMTQYIYEKRGKDADSL